MDEETKTIAIKLTKAEWQELKEIAMQETRSVGAQAYVAIKAYLAGRKEHNDGK